MRCWTTRTKKPLSPSTYARRTSRGSLFDNRRSKRCASLCTLSRKHKATKSVCLHFSCGASIELLAREGVQREVTRYSAEVVAFTCKFASCLKKWCHLVSPWNHQPVADPQEACRCATPSPFLETPALIQVLERSLVGWEKLRIRGVNTPLRKVRHQSRTVETKMITGIPFPVFVCGFIISSYRVPDSGPAELVFPSPVTGCASTRN